MASWFLLALSAVVMIGITVFAGATLVSTLSDGPSHAQTLRQLNATADLLLASAWQGADGSIYLPAPSAAGPGPIEGVATLPTWIKASSTFPQGQVVVYCPFAPTNGITSADVRNPDGTRYQIDTTTFLGRSYVTAGRPAYVDASTNPNLAGFLLIPELAGNTYAGCNQITQNGTTYSAPGMLVRPIFLDRAALSRNNNVVTRVFYANTNGTGSGSHASDPISLTSALARWRSTPFANTRIELISTGSYSLNSDALSSAATDYVAHPAGSQLTIVGPAAATTTITLASNGIVNLPVNLDISGLSLAATNLISVNPNYRLLVRSATVGPIEVGAQAIASLNASNMGVNLSSRPGFSILAGGQAVVEGAFTATLTSAARFADIKSGGVLTMKSGTQSFSATTSPAVTVESGGAFNAVSATLSLPTSVSTLFRFNGAVTLVSSTFSYSANLASIIFDVRDGGSLSLTNSTISGTTNTGLLSSIVSNNAGLVAGSGSTVFGCWSDASGPPVFSYSGTTNGSSSAVGSDEIIAPLGTTPTALEVSTFMDARSRNAARAAARTRNRSAWTCST